MQTVNFEVWEAHCGNRVDDAATFLIRTDSADYWPALEDALEHFGYIDPLTIADVALPINSECEVEAEAAAGEDAHLREAGLAEERNA